jgi:hypothetical protein
MSLCGVLISLRRCGRGRDERRSSVVGSALGSCCSYRRLCGGAVAGEERNDAEMNNIMLGATEKRVSERASSQSAGASRVFIEQSPPRARARDGGREKEGGLATIARTTGGCLIDTDRTDDKTWMH